MQFKMAMCTFAWTEECRRGWSITTPMAQLLFPWTFMQEMIWRWYDRHASIPHRKEDAGNLIKQLDCAGTLQAPDLHADLVIRTRISNCAEAEAEAEATHRLVSASAVSLNCGDVVCWRAQDRRGEMNERAERSATARLVMPQTAVT
ncbi:hypothetical protein AK830_g962 [Neonectria ditissima]|uniref:Uncharacterized protein n=1 Tax=Neonectria ditissima TaxID=78410 RepID=A0A0P7BJZ8_9HYPO|nr:hypothetical protein AK830_g962 [Neonectria ditissima]